MKDFVKVRGTEFVKAGRPVLFRGLGIGSWLNLEHFMVGLPTPDNQLRKAVASVFGEETARRFFDAFIRSFVTEQDFSFLKSLGVNVVRVPFNYRLFIDDNAPGAYKPEGFAYLDSLMDLCEKYRIYLLPDLHTVPGGQNPDWHSDNNSGIPQFWHYKVFRDQIVGLWGHIAEHWKDREYLLGYDLLNEPYLMDAPALLPEFYQEVTQAIRCVDQNHIIFLEGDNFAMRFDCIGEITDPNTALSFHYYPTVWEPELFGKAYDKAGRQEKFREILEKIASVREDLHRPVLCGEAGYDIDPNDVAHSMELLEETLSLFNDREISWTLWCYKDARFMGLAYPKSGSPWMRLAERARKRWDHYKERQQAYQMIGHIGEYPEFSLASEALKEAMRFRQQAILYRFQRECILEPLLREYSKEELLELPKSFLLENCQFYPEYAALLQRMTAGILSEPIQSI
ncbi:glycoside hydrolase family 5 protein [Acutalibacter sp. 1XD8-33]|uniref:glycoside hydrolase family 5 protein n=1 Tax=Acutalibacter sp. 1XD8-33 TaxID=2320081 RepID=UPI001FAA810B|nr:cellulase family glycosylhydrolase [Acutalibacter sp. 1XD8-33]